MAQSCRDVIRVTDNNKRYLGSYFRVGFYGDAFDAEIRNRQFVYKEPTITSLSEISLRLQVALCVKVVFLCKANELSRGSPGILQESLERRCARDDHRFEDG
jgi:hypothetical protein